MIGQSDYDTNRTKSKRFIVVDRSTMLLYYRSAVTAYTVLGTNKVGDRWCTGRISTEGRIGLASFSVCRGRSGHFDHFWPVMRFGWTRRDPQCTDSTLSLSYIHERLSVHIQTSRIISFLFFTCCHWWWDHPRWLSKYTCGVPVLSIMAWGMFLPTCTVCDLSIRKSGTW